MPKLTQTVTATTTQEIQLQPATRKQLLAQMKEWAGYQLQIKELEAKQEKCVEKVGAVLTDVGESTLALEGYRATLVCGFQNKLDKTKLKPASLADVNRCTTSVPKKAFVKITPPSSKERGE